MIKQNRWTLQSPFIFVEKDAWKNSRFFTRPFWYFLILFFCRKIINHLLVSRPTFFAYSAFSLRSKASFSFRLSSRVSSKTTDALSRNSFFQFRRRFGWILFSVAIVFKSFSPLSSSITNSDLNLAEKSLSFYSIPITSPSASTAFLTHSGHSQSTFPVPTPFNSLQIVAPHFCWNFARISLE